MTKNFVAVLMGSDYLATKVSSDGLLSISQMLGGIS